MCRGGRGLIAVSWQTKIDEMRCLPLLIFVVMLAGCPAPPGAATPTPVPTPSATPEPTPVQVQVDINYEGAWSAADGDGEMFDVIFFANGQVVTNWMKGSTGPRGERGFWRRDGARAVAFYDDGWTDVFEPAGDGFVHRGFSPGTALNMPPSNEAPASRVADPRARFVGVWRLSEEPADSYTFVAVKSDGRAVSSVNGRTEGTWEPDGDGFVCRWPDGWTDRIANTDNGWVKMSWLGEPEGEPADQSVAVRVGETKFLIAP